MTTEGEGYSVDAREPRPSAALLRGAEALPLDDDLQSRLTALPPLDPTVTDLVSQLTADATGPYERVRAILDYLTDREQRVHLQPVHRSRAPAATTWSTSCASSVATASSTPARWP